MPSVTVNSEGQAAIPPEILAFWQLSPGDRIDFLIEPNGRVLIQPAAVEDTEAETLTPPKLAIAMEKLKRGEQITPEDLRGLLHQEGMKPLSPEDIDEAIGTYLGQKYARNRVRERD